MSHHVGRVSTSVHQATEFVSYCTGRSHDELVVVSVAAATSTVSVAAWRGFAWAVDAITGFDLRPPHLDGHHA